MLVLKAYPKEEHISWIKCNCWKLRRHPRGKINCLSQKHNFGQSHTYYLMTRQASQTNQFHDFLIGRSLKEHDPTSHQQQYLLTQLAQYNNFLPTEHKPKHQNSGSNDSTNCIIEAIARTPTHQRSQEATICKPPSTKTLICDGRNEKFVISENLFHEMPEMQLDMIKAT